MHFGDYSTVICSCYPGLGIKDFALAHPTEVACIEMKDYRCTTLWNNWGVEYWRVLDAVDAIIQAGDKKLLLIDGCNQKTNWMLGGNGYAYLVAWPDKTDAVKNLISAKLATDYAGIEDGGYISNDCVEFYTTYCNLMGNTGTHSSGNTSLFMAPFYCAQTGHNIPQDFGGGRYEPSADTTAWYNNRRITVTTANYNTWMNTLLAGINNHTIKPHPGICDHYWPR